jgi:hypothetical protein
MCWSRIVGAGVFDSDAAKAIGDELLATIEREMQWREMARSLVFNGGGARELRRHADNIGNVARDSHELSQDERAMLFGVVGIVNAIAGIVEGRR